MNNISWEITEQKAFLGVVSTNQRVQGPWISENRNLCRTQLPKKVAGISPQLFHSVRNENKMFTHMELSVRYCTRLWKSGVRWDRTWMAATCCCCPTSLLSKKMPSEQKSSVLEPQKHHFEVRTPNLHAVAQETLRHGEAHNTYL